MKMRPGKFRLIPVVFFLFFAAGQCSAGVIFGLGGGSFIAENAVSVPASGFSLQNIDQQITYHVSDDVTETWTIKGLAGDLFDTSMPAEVHPFPWITLEFTSDTDERRKWSIAWSRLGLKYQGESEWTYQEDPFKGAALVSTMNVTDTIFWLRMRWRINRPAVPVSNGVGMYAAQWRNEIYTGAGIGYGERKVQYVYDLYGLHGLAGYPGINAGWNEGELYRKEIFISSYAALEFFVDMAFEWAEEGASMAINIHLMPRVTISPGLSTFGMYVYFSFHDLPGQPTKVIDTSKPAADITRFPDQ